ncbi:MAG TPA: ATP-binding protein [Gemmataceae bacterium]|nr:ATP-binding protein [Gemmataceae bacterium]
MDRRILIQITAPAVVIGFLLFGTCVVSAWMVNHQQANLSNVLAENVTSLDAAQDLETSVRQLHVHCYRYLSDPDRPLVDREVTAAIEHDNAMFRTALERAEGSAITPEEQECVQQIKEGHQRYQQAFEKLRAEATMPRQDYRMLADETPIDLVIKPCERFMRLNKAMMSDTRSESERLSRILSVVMLLLGLVGPTSGLIIGWGMARGLSRSIHRLSVRVHGMAQQLEQDVASVSLTPDGDVRNLDRQLDKVVARVQEVAQQVQQHQREMIRAQQLSAVGQLAASVAHEVRNPLMSIKMLVEAALRADNPRPFTRENLSIIHHEIERLEKSVQDFLDFSRPPVLQRTVCDPRDVVAAAIALVQTRARQQKVEIVSDRPKDEIRGLIDRDQLCSVLVNLFINALDAMPRGGRLEVRLGTSGGAIDIAVRDTGEGIAPVVLEQLFTPFTSSKPTGTGLGLCISRRIMEDHGGQLHGANAPEGGACFLLTLPAAIEQTEAEVPSPDPSKRERQTVSQER